MVASGLSWKGSTDMKDPPIIHVALDFKRENYVDNVVCFVNSYPLESDLSNR